MHKYTTINIDPALLKLLSKASESLSTSRVNMIAILIYFMSRKPHRNLEQKIGIEYQPRSQNTEWHVFHLRLKRAEYNFYQDMRTICKMSISYIIAYALENHLDEIMKRLTGDITRYRLCGYAIIQHTIGNITCWAKYWGIPKSLLTVSPG